jgi:hypothetical protein
MADQHHAQPRINPMSNMSYENDAYEPLLRFSRAFYVMVLIGTIYSKKRNGGVVWALLY